MKIYIGIFLIMSLLRFFFLSAAKLEQQGNFGAFVNKKLWTPSCSGSIGTFQKVFCSLHGLISFSRATVERSRGRGGGKPRKLDEIISRVSRFSWEATVQFLAQRMQLWSCRTCRVLAACIVVGHLNQAHKGKLRNANKKGFTNQRASNQHSQGPKRWSRPTPVKGKHLGSNLICTCSRSYIQTHTYR